MSQKDFMTIKENHIIFKNKLIMKIKLSNGLNLSKESLTKLQLAELVSTEFLQIHFREYDIFIVDYSENKTFLHVYAFKKSLLLGCDMDRILGSSFQINKKLSYYEMFNKVNQ